MRLKYVENRTEYISQPCFQNTNGQTMDSVFRNCSLQKISNFFEWKAVKRHSFILDKSDQYFIYLYLSTDSTIFLLLTTFYFETLKSKPIGHRLRLIKLRIKHYAIPTQFNIKKCNDIFDHLSLCN